MNLVVQTINLKKTYGTDDLAVNALNGANINIKKGEKVAIVGSSGSGKSTLLNLIGGIDRPTEGKIYIEGKNICKYNDEELALLRRQRIGFVFQMYNLMPQLNVYENVILPLGLDGRKVSKEDTKYLLDMLGIYSKAKHFPNQLSGGQQQRVAIARALIMQPAILLADEPTGNLDSNTASDVLNLLRTSGKQLEQTIAIITHDNSIAQSCDRIFKIEDGVILEVEK